MVELNYLKKGLDEVDQALIEVIPTNGGKTPTEIYLDALNSNPIIEKISIGTVYNRLRNMVNYYIRPFGLTCYHVKNKIYYSKAEEKEE